MSKRRMLIAAQARDAILNDSDSESVDSESYSSDDGSDDDGGSSDDQPPEPRTPGHTTSADWSIDPSSFPSASAVFHPREQVGPKDMPSDISAESSPEQFLSRFWSDDIWQLLVDETNRQAQYVKTKKPNNYVAKAFTAVTIDKMRAFFACRLAMEVLVHKNRYEQYWRQKYSWITSTPVSRQVHQK